MKSFRFVFTTCMALGVTCFSVLAQPVAPKIENLTLVSQVPRLTIQSEVGTTNVIEYENELKANRWWPLTNLVVTNNPYVYVDLGASPLLQRFYRVLVPCDDYVPPATNTPAGMVLIPSGGFTMGDAFGDGSTNEQPTHIVQVSAFYMDKYEVTKALWDEVCQWAIANGYSFTQSDSAVGTNYPVRSTTWYDMVKWCNARSEKEGLVPAYYTSATQTTMYRDGWIDIQNSWVKWNTGYRLPTEAEWEKAARGGLSGKRYPWGDTIEQRMANYGTLWDYSMTPVGAFAANGYGLYDMAGNIWEWCWDWYGPYGSDAQSDPRGPTNPVSDTTKIGRVMRGGSWYSLSFYLRCSYRSPTAPTISGLNYGFRCVRGL